MTKIGIFGGSFDPIHFGHIYLAMQAKDEAELDRIIFVPANLQPFKLDRKATDGRRRAEMIELSVQNYDGAIVSPYELNRDEVSYTVNTLRHFRDEFGNSAEIYFITGTDAFLKIDTRKDADEILSGYSFIIGSRPGYKDDELKAKINELKSKYGCNIIVVHNTQIDVSSTELREKLKNGESVKDYINPKVERYIQENGLYK